MGIRMPCKLQLLLLTRGLLRVPSPVDPGALVEIVFLTPTGPVVGMAELLTRCSVTLRCSQPFQFIARADEGWRRLRMAIRFLLDKSGQAVPDRTTRKSGERGMVVPLPC